MSLLIFQESFFYNEDSSVSMQLYFLFSTFSYKTLFVLLSLSINLIIYSFHIELL